MACRGMSLYDLLPARGADGAPGGRAAARVAADG